METVDLLDKYFETAFAAPDGIKRLRELILTLAMQGKLVPQNPKDRSASELLKDIETEKKQLIKEGKIKKSKPLPEITLDEIPYDLPDSWEWVKLDDISVKIHYGYTASANYDLKDVRLLRITDIQDNQVNWEFVPGCAIEKKDLDQYLLLNNDILIARTGGTVGKSYLVKNINVNSVFASYLIRVIPSKNIDSNYLKLFIESPLYWKQLYAKCSGTGQPNVNGTALSNLLITFPPLSEQHRIVEKIDRLMEQVDRLEKLQKERDRKRLIIHAAASDRLLNAPDKNSFNDAWNFIQNNFNELYSVKENISELRKAILQLAVMGKLVPQNPNDPPASELLKEIEAEKERLIKEGKIKKQKLLPEIKPEEIPYELANRWNWVRFEDVVDIITGVSKGKKYKNKEMILLPYLRVANVQRGYLDLETIKYLEIPVSEFSRYEVLKDDLLIIEGGDWDKVGRTAIWNSEISHCIHQNHVFKGRRFLKKLNVYWLQLYLNSTSARDYFAGASKQTTNLASINKTQLRSCLIPLPPLPEQHRIVAKVDRLMALCDRLEAQLTKQTEKQTALLNVVTERCS